MLSSDYQQVLDYLAEKTLVYLDLAYKPRSQTSGFNSYSYEVFDDAEPVRLKEFCDILDLRNCKCLLSNSDVKTEENSNRFVDDVYSNHHSSRVLATRLINFKRPIHTLGL